MKFITASVLFTSAVALMAQAPPANVATATPASLLFAQTLPGSTSSQTLAIALAANATGTTYTATSSASWLTVTPASGTVPGSLTVTANPASLTAGTNSGTITIALSGTNMGQLVVPVIYVLTTSPALVTSTTMLSVGGGFGLNGGGTPGGPGGGGMPGDPGSPGGGAMPMAPGATFQLASTAGASPFTATISNTCANAFSVAPLLGTTPATLTVTEDMTIVAGGTNCSGIVTLTSPGLASVSVAVSATVPDGGGMPPIGGMTATPTVTKIVNGASYVEGAVSPGEIVTVFGSNLGLTTLTSGTFTNGTLATTLGTMQVTFGGSAAPILYARSDQMSVVVPFDAGSGLVNMQILSSGQTVSTTQIPVVSAVPGIFTTASSGSGQAAVLNQDNTINSTTNAAARGSVVSIYLTGAGSLMPSGASGDLASTTQLQRIIDPVTVTIGGQKATVNFAGAVPGSLLGLYQVNAVVPTAATGGNAAIQISVGAATSQTGVTLNVK